MKRKKTVLIVEDEAVLAIDTANILQDFGFEVILTSTGEEAVDLGIENSNIDLVLMDIDLGKGINGINASKQILARRNIPIVFRTFHSDETFLNQVNLINRYGFILKSAGKHVLLSTIKLAFDLFESQKNLIMEKEKYCSLFRSSNDGIAVYKMITDENGKYINYEILDVNHAFETITGLKKEESIGKRATELYNCKVAPYIDVFSKVVETNQSCSFETTYELIGRSFNISVFSPQPGNFVTLFSDITKRKKEEEEKALLIKELEEKIDESKNIEGFLSICAKCKKIRDAKNHWHPVADYLAEHTDLEFSHGICPDCAKIIYGEDFYNKAMKDE